MQVLRAGAEVSAGDLAQRTRQAGAVPQPQREHLAQHTQQAGAVPQPQREQPCLLVSVICLDKMLDKRNSRKEGLV